MPLVAYNLMTPLQMNSAVDGRGHVGRRAAPIWIEVFRLA